MTFLYIQILPALINWQPIWEDHGIPLAIMGLIVVFAALTLLCIFIGVLPRIIAIIDRLHPEQARIPVAAPTAQAPATTTAAEATDELPEEILAVIAAVVAATVTEPHRIVRMREVSSQDSSWSLEGRRQHHASHAIRPRDPR